MSNPQNIREKILQEIEQLSDTKQEEVLGLVENYIHQQNDETEWKKIPDNWKKRIEESIKQADAGEVTLNEDAVKYIRKKYKLDE
ncbi:MAG: hypothetical protein HYR66_13690 [Sphingobacteriales bacterium]|nr:hypothetical protein [Sphingobacteriales bacterium]MBI3719736.1 hypothetical protein [Sphingobacteriales bacterium]